MLGTAIAVKAIGHTYVPFRKPAVIDAHTKTTHVQRIQKRMKTEVSNDNASKNTDS